MSSFLKFTERFKHEPPQPNKSSYEVIVIGGGHNGLICAAYLANADLDVVVLEGRDEAGGFLQSEEVEGGYLGSLGAHLIEGISAQVVRDLKLGRHGLDYVKKDISTIALNGEGGVIKIGSDLEATQSSIQKISELDAASYPKFKAKMAKYTSVMKSMVGTPPRLDRPDQALTWLQNVQALDPISSHDFIRICLSSVGDVLDEYFESDLVKSAIAFDGIQGGGLGPRDMGTMAALLWRWAHRELAKDSLAVPKGGMDNLVEALVSAAESKGAAIRPSARVQSILMDGGEVYGVELEGGEQITAPHVVSSLDPKTTFLNLIGPRHLDTELVQKMKHLKTQGSVAKLILALDSMPFFNGLGDHDWGERLIIAPDMDYAQRSSRAVKYQELPKEIIMEVMVPSVFDPSLAPLGGQVLSANVQYVPFAPEGGWEKHKETLATKIIKTLTYYAPNLEGMVRGGELWTPSELASAFGSSGGHWHQVEWSLDQAMSLRPSHNTSQYVTPVEGLYLCGAGCHPGGGITGLPGLNAAKQIIPTLKAATKGGS